ncbi:hypothetical protein Cni_G07746 [Canna indica]|uniref:RRM domain-containing protein n=1 Tax=Canna indica TaxID=4628 RepID=A0AAQ3JZ14_9LILI|nr:hypothetical protein Cni_G07746 [Canna indica]
MGKKSKGSDVQSLFSVDNPFRRKPQEESPAAPPNLGLVIPDKSLNSVDLAEERKRKRDKTNGTPTSVSTPASIPKKRKKLENDGEGELSKEKRKKRKRDEIEEEYEKRMYGAAEIDAENGRRTIAVGEKRKQDDVIALDMTVPKESFDDESKLMRTVFVGNLPLKTKRKALLKVFANFGEIDSVRIRSVPIVDSKTPRKGAIIKGKINEAVDSVHAYIVFKDEQSAKAALSQNMSEFGGNHIRVDIACPPCKKLRGEGALYDRKRTVFVGNLPFDVKDEELYQLFCGEAEYGPDVEAVRVIRDPHTSLGKGIAYVLFKTRDAANAVVRKRNLKVRDRIIRVCHAKSTDATPSKRKNIGPKRESPQKKLAGTNGGIPLGKNDQPKAKAATLSYQGLRSSKSGVVKKSNLQRKSISQRNQKIKRDGGSDEKAHKGKRPAVAARKAKQLMKKRKQENGTPENARMKKKARKQ